jgi:hypothetical protein
MVIWTKNCTESLEDELGRTIEYGVSKLGFERHQVIFQHDNDPKHTVADKTGAENLKSTLHLRLLWHMPSERQSKIYIMLCKLELCRTSLRHKVIFSDFLNISILAKNVVLV